MEETLYKVRLLHQSIIVQFGENEGLLKIGVCQLNFELSYRINES